MRWRRKTLRQVLLLSTLSVVVCFILFLKLRLSPLVKELALARVENKASNIINDAIEEQLKENDINYDSMVAIEKTVYGEVSALRTNMAEINRLKTEVLSTVDSLLLDLDVEEVGLPLGSLIFPELFSGSGPKIPVKVLSVSNSDADFRNVFSEAGINQTTHRIMMDVKVYMTILTPAGTENVEAISSVVVAETVIVGNVPQTYVDVGA